MHRIDPWLAFQYYFCCCCCCCCCCWIFSWSAKCPVFHIWYAIFSLLYSQTCSNDHLHNATTCLRQPMLSPPKQIPIQSILYEMTTCLTRPAANFFVPQMNKTCLNKHYKTLTSEKKGNKHKATMDKHKRLSDYIYSISTL